MLEALIFPIATALLILTLGAWLISRKTEKKICSTVMLVITLITVITIAAVARSQTNGEIRAHELLAETLAQRYDLSFQDVTPEDLPVLSGGEALTQPLLIVELQRQKYDYDCFYHILYSSRFGNLNDRVLAETRTLVFAERMVFETRTYQNSVGEIVEVPRIGAVLYCFDLSSGRFTIMLIVEPPAFSAEITGTDVLRVTDQEIVQYALDHGKQS